MINPTPTAMYTDFSGLSRMRLEARRDPDGSLRAVAEQFEAIFLQMVLKSMREASFGDALFDSDQSKFYREMSDSQMAMNMADGGDLGLADAIVRQLGGAPAHASGVGGVAVHPAGIAAAARRSAPARPAPDAEAAEQSAAVQQAVSATFERPLEFVRAVWEHAREAAAALGTAPEALVAQAALETGWGRHILQRPDGASSHNLFGIKADSRWLGERVSAATLEFRAGVVEQERASFRAYDSLAESFADYVRLLKSNPRYRPALASDGDPEAFAGALQRSGYATDPAYADKIRGILRGDLLRDALGGLKL